MSINGSLSGITFSGLGSGIDTASIVSQLISLERLPINRMQTQKTRIQTRQAYYNELKARTSSVAASLGTLKQSATLNAVKGTSANTEVATVSVSAAANPGSYLLKVSQLAAAQRSTSTVQASSSTALGYTGTFTVNGKILEVAATDTLAGIAAKVNALGVGVSANVITGQSGDAYLSLSSTATGQKNAISLANVSGTALASLGFLGGTSSLRDATGTTARSVSFASASQSLGSLTGLTGTADFDVNGTTVTVDFATDTLDSLATKISAEGSVTATVKTDSATNRSYLELDGASLDTLLADTSGVLKQLGIFQNNFAQPVTAAQDAMFTLDGIAMRSTTNTVSTAVNGVTMTLKKANATTPEESLITVERDTDTVVNSFKAFADAYNNLNGFIRQNSSFDAETFESGALFGDPIARQLEDIMSDLIFQTKPDAATGDLNSLLQIGFGRDNTGKLTLDESRLREALTNNASGVSKLFSNAGSTTGADLAFITGTNASRNLSAASVVITRAATAHLVASDPVGGTPQVAGEILTFSGSIFGNSNVLFSIPSGIDQSEIANLINSDSRLKDLVTASYSSGTLSITSKTKGTPGAFTVTSNFASAAGTSGIGTSGGNITAGVDVEGTINGEAATGLGTLLTGNSGNANTEGVQIRYSGTATGNVGTVTFSQGLAARLENQMLLFSDSVKGIFKAQDDSLTSQIADIDRTIANREAVLALREASLKARFQAMDSAISAFRAQQAQLTAALTGQR
ncbi:MAG: hypothetical protein Fur0036_01420 [Fimbriimonadaceae bacterium]